MVYEVVTFQTLREQLRCKEIWVVGADRWRNPDFESRRIEHYRELRKPLDPTKFRDGLREEMTSALAELNDSLPSLDWVEIADRKAGAIKEPYQLLGAHEARIDPVATYLKDLLAAGSPASTLRSCGMDLLRWWRFLWAVGDLERDRAMREDARDFMLWMQLADKPKQVHWRRRGKAADSTSATPSEIAGSHRCRSSPAPSPSPPDSASTPRPALARRWSA
ncbi:hypothetical protein ACIBF6_36295 [Streptosporangium amethystogenes]|uniref:hypothetical protein n=1 Tax=Streptosporangium amethystogenes TaxID=2002 RepID=UPI0037BD305B